MIATLDTKPMPRRLMAGAARTALLLAVALGGAACSLTAKRDDVTGSMPIDYRQRHPIAIREGDRKMEVFIGARRGSLTPTQREEVANFATLWRHEATGGIVIEVPSGGANSRAAQSAASDVRSVLARAGVPAEAVASRGYRPDNPHQLGTLRLRYPKMVAQAGPCGLWPEDLGLPHDAQPTMNRPYWNLGCANQRNLAAMVDNPADLVQPRTESPIYSARRSVVLDKHRKGESSATVYPDASKGKISDIGQ